MKSFHRFLVREGLAENHPAAGLPLPKVPERLPDVISVDDAERLLAQPFPPGPRRAFATAPCSRCSTGAACA